MAEEKNKKKSDIDSRGTIEEVVSEHISMQKKDKKNKKMKNRETKDISVGEDGDIIRRERGKLDEDALVKKKLKKQRIDSEIDDDGTKLKKKSKEKRVYSSEADDVGVKKSKKKNKETKVDSEAEDDVVKKSKKKNRETKVDSEDEDCAKEKLKKKKKKKSKKESGSDVIENSESSKVDQGIEGNQRDDKLLDDANRKTGKRKRDESDLGDEENTEPKEMKRKSKKNKPSEDSEADENDKDSTKDAKKKSKPNVDSEIEDNNKDSTKDAKKEKKKKEKKQSEDSEVEENNNDGTKEAKKKRKNKKQSEVSEVEENNNDGAKEAKKKRKKKQECGKNDKDVATPSSKSTKKVKFSDQVEIFPAEDEESEEEEGGVKLVRGKRYSKEEDELIKGSVLEYIDNHALGDEGLKMVMECKSHPQVKGCWKEIASALPWRTYDSVYNRAHTIFEAGSRGVWSKEDLQLVIEFQKKHGNDWRTLADAMGKHRKHVKDAWRRTRLASTNKGNWKREEYQALFDLVNKDLRMKAFQEKHSKHGMLRDNIPWMAISDKLGSRDHVTCCGKWYDQLQSPMIAKGIWANVDDYRLLEELLKLDAACIDDVDWDNLLENRDGEACRKRWSQMVLHIGSPRSKTFAEQVEILSDRYCPDLAEDREDFDNRPYDPEG